MIKSVIVEKSINGKFRYFFDVRNNGIEDFNGEVSIYLYSNNSILGGDTFTTTHPINPTLGFATFIEMNTGTSLEHGEYVIPFPLINDTIGYL